MMRFRDQCELIAGLYRSNFFDMNSKLFTCSTLDIYRRIGVIESGKQDEYVRFQPKAKKKHFNFVTRLWQALKIKIGGWLTRFFNLKVFTKLIPTKPPLNQSEPISQADKQPKSPPEGKKLQTPPQSDIPTLTPVQQKIEQKAREIYVSRLRQPGLHQDLQEAKNVMTHTRFVGSLWGDWIAFEYKKIRKAAYPEDKRHHPAIDKLTSLETPQLKVIHDDEGSWHFRVPRDVTNTDNDTITDRLSLNVCANPQLIECLDDLFASGAVKGFYKTPSESQRWISRHDPITIYLKEPLNTQIENRLASLVKPFIRSTENVLPGRIIIPGITCEKNPTQEQMEEAIKEATSFHPSFGNKARQTFTRHNQDGEPCLKASTGEYNSVRRIIDLLKAA